MLANFVADTLSGADASPAAITESALGPLAARLFEAIDSFEDSAGWNLVGGSAKATTSGGPMYHFNSWAQLRDRADGRYLPYYDDEYDLRRLRSAARRLATITSVVTGIAHALEVYCMQGEWRHEAKQADGFELPNDLVKAAQSLIDRNLERNDFVGGLDRELDGFAREEGETIVGIYPTGDRSGESDWRRLDATSLIAPRNPNRLDNYLSSTPRRSWSFGVLTDYDSRQRRVDHTRHLGYHVIFDEAGNDWDFLPSWPQAHLGELGGKCGVLYKRNVPAEAKRGLSDYLPIQIDLEREAKLTENLSVGAAILAAIPWIEKVGGGAGQPDLNAAVNNALTAWEKAARGKTPSGGKRKLDAGQVPRIPANTEYIAGPLGSVRQPIYIEVAQFLQRRCGQRFVMPEYMVSGDASNANYASTVQATSPFVKARENDQRQDEKCFQEIHWRAMRVAYDAGYFARWNVPWRVLRRALLIEVEGPEVASADKAAVLAQATALFDRKLMDGSEVRQVLDFTHDEKYDGVTGSMVQPMQPGATTESRGRLLGFSVREGLND
jgi:hypothetical protein